MNKKMNKKLNKSPLTYVLAQVKISGILQMESYIPALQESLRKQFPIPNRINTQAIDFSSIGHPVYGRLTQWHFTDKKSTTGILIGTDLIIVHTSDYSSFENIMDITEGALGKFKEIVDPTLCTRIGLRYINLINAPVKKYLKEELLGFWVKKGVGFEDKYVSKLETTQKSAQGFVKIKSNHVNDLVAGKPSLIPQDLITVANLLSFKQHLKKLRAPEYVMLDMDHFTLNKNDDFKVKQILQQFDKLHDGIEVAFAAAVTLEALKEWE